MTRVVQGVCDGRPSDGDIITLDPRLPPSGALAPTHDTAFTQAVVFVVGGGTYNEYNNLAEYARVRVPSPLCLCVYGTNNYCVGGCAGAEGTTGPHLRQHGDVSARGLPVTTQ